jgi:hypothetical protein
VLSAAISEVAVGALNRRQGFTFSFAESYVVNGVADDRAIEPDQLVRLKRMLKRHRNRMSPPLCSHVLGVINMNVPID